MKSVTRIWVPFYDTTYCRQRRGSRHFRRSFFLCLPLLLRTWRHHLAPELLYRKTSFSPTAGDRLRVPPSPLFSGTADFTCLKRRGMQLTACHLVKNEWNCTYIFPYAFTAWRKFTMCLYIQIYALPTAVTAPWRWSVAAQMLGLWVRIPEGDMDVLL